MEHRKGTNGSKLRGKLLIDELNLGESLLKLRRKLSIWQDAMNLSLLCLERIDRSV